MKHTVKFGWLGKGLWGCAYFDTNQIVINLDLYLCDVYVHEKLHLAHHDWGEQRVLRETKRTLSRLKVSQIRALARRVKQKARRK